MIEVNNKFEIGEEVYTGVRVPVKYKCPICDGKGKFMHNGYEVRCSNCQGSRELHNSHQFLLEPVKVRVRRIIASIWNDEVTVKYKVNCSEANVRNRSESTLFRSLEEAEQYCKECSTKKKAAEF
ncbi:hypothetical protein [Enterocloster bolteae]|uniref:hypothetical protein n=1 Tax=Enterocloster bolteae TaxID=208479 RepID=UPI0034A3DC9A